MKPTFVLIHGGFHGAWCWDPIIPALVAAGHPVIAPDLPGMGSDRTPHQLITQTSTVDFVVDILRGQPRPAIVIGHSMGGMVLSEAAQRCPEAVVTLVFLTAVLRAEDAPVIGRSAAPRPPVMTTSADGHSIICDPDSARDLLYSHTAPTLADEAVSRLQPQPIATMMATTTGTLNGFGKVPRAYVECTRDQVMPIAYQRSMQSVLPCDPVIALESDHSPFMSAPEPLVAALLTIAARFET